MHFSRSNFLAVSHKAPGLFFSTLPHPLRLSTMPQDADPITISTLSRINAPTLANMLLSPSSAPKVAIIDVRDSDHIGGHIKSSDWVPANELDARIPELMRVHKDKEKIVFHCMLSQQRGPAAALKFARAMKDKNERERKQQQQVEGKEEGKKADGGAMGDKDPRPEVCVLEGGFGTWQARYGEDERLTEGYVKDLWE